MKLKTNFEQGRRCTKSMGIAAACCVLLGGSTFANDQSTQAKQPPSAKEFVTGAIDASQLELKAGKLAVEKAENPEVKELGRMLVNDHKEIKNKLQDLAAKHDAKWNESLQQEHQQEWNKLQSASGLEFDRLFVKHVVKDHERDLAMINECRDKFSDDPQLQALINEYTPVMQRHLEKARTIARNIGLPLETEIGSTQDREPVVQTPAAGAAAPSERGSETQAAEENDSGVDFENDDGEILGLPTSNNDGTILGLIPAPSREITVGADESYIAEELADGKVDPNIENVFQADRDVVTAPSTFDREKSAAKFTGPNQANNTTTSLPAEVRNALQERGWNAQAGDVKRVTVYAVEVDGKTVYASEDGTIYQPSE